MISWYFSSSGFSTSMFFLLGLVHHIFNHVVFFLVFLKWLFFPSMVIVKVAMTHLWSLLHVDHVVALGVCIVSQEYPLG